MIFLRFSQNKYKRKRENRCHVTLKPLRSHEWFWKFEEAGQPILKTREEKRTRPKVRSFSDIYQTSGCCWGLVWAQNDLQKKKLWAKIDLEKRTIILAREQGLSWGVGLSPGWGCSQPNTANGGEAPSDNHDATSELKTSDEPLGIASGSRSHRTQVMQAEV